VITSAPAICERWCETSVPTQRCSGCFLNRHLPFLRQAFGLCCSAQVFDGAPTGCISLSPGACAARQALSCSSCFLHCYRLFLARPFGLCF
jgi:hypothetical protein